MANLAAGIVQMILGKVSSPVSNELLEIYNAESEFGKLERTLPYINALLQEAAQQHPVGPIRAWLVNLKDAAYDIEDVLDLISTRHLDRKVNGQNPILRLYARYTLAKQVKEIRGKLDEIGKNKIDFNIQVVVGGSPLADQKETYSRILESEVFGRDQDKESIVSLLVRSDSEGEQFLVIAITGMGGIGKTTLAKLVYNDPRVTDGFKLRLWVHVSKEFVLKTVIADIIQSANGQDYSSLKLEPLQVKLHEILRDSSFLLVLDNVWDDALEEWDELKELLVVDSSSAIIVTTRDERVASSTGTTKPFRVKELSWDDCRSIFMRRAFKEHEGKPNPTLVRIGESIIRKCKGVPLAVKTLGSLLHDKRDVDTWKKIEESELWETKHGILPALKLSFDHTPYHLRSCFAYCAVFRKGYPLNRHDLINVWMAQGLLQLQDREEIEVGDEYFEDLLSRSFFQVPGLPVIEKYVMEAAGVFSWHPDWVSLAQSFKNETIGDVDTITKQFRDYRGKLPFVEMHDLMHDLAAHVAGEEIRCNISSSTSEISERARHLAWGKEDLSGKEFPKGLLKASKARTFAFLHPMGSLSKSFLESLLSNFKCLRVLMLMESEFEELPDLIGELKHLRYIDVCLNSKLKLLPNAICKLVNLQVLDFAHCNELEKLPKDMHRLVSLRSLFVTSKATCLPKRGFHCWTSLRILKFINCVNLTSLEGIGSLKSLRIFGVERCSGLKSLPNEMEGLTNLEELSIGHCQQLDLAGWKALYGLKKLEYLRVYGIPKLIHFPDGLVSVAKSLQHFRVGDCEALTSLPEELQHCTSLLKLDVFVCPNIPALPKRIQDLKDLLELTIGGCSYLSKRCERVNGEDWPLISHVPCIRIDYQVIQSNRAPSTEE